MHLQASLNKTAVQLAISIERLVRGRLIYSPEDLSHFRDFLFLQYRMPLAYCVHDTPIYEALRACMPDARITVATRGTGFETLRHNPFVDHVIVTGDPLVDMLRATHDLRRELKRRRIQPAIGITNCSNPRTRISLLNALAGRHVRLGHTLQPRLYHLPQRYDRSMSLIDNNLCLVTIFGCPTVHVEPRVFFRDQDVEKVRALLKDKGINKHDPLTIFVTQNSGSQKTGWHTQRFVQVIRYVSRQSQIVFVGTGKDTAAIEALRREAAVLDDFATASLAGETSIPELAALLCMADYAISLDTGAMHVGRAAEVPMVVLSPSRQNPLVWLPLGMERVRILRGEDLTGQDLTGQDLTDQDLTDQDLAGEDIDRTPEHYRLDEIEVRHVIEAFEELVQLYPPSHLEREARIRDSTSNVDHAGGRM